MRQFAIRYGVIKLDVKRKRNKMFSTSNLLAHIYRRGNKVDESTMIGFLDFHFALTSF